MTNGDDNDDDDDDNDNDDNDDDDDDHVMCVFPVDGDFRAMRCWRATTTTTTTTPTTTKTTTITLRAFPSDLRSQISNLSVAAAACEGKVPKPSLTRRKRLVSQHK